MSDRDDAPPAAAVEALARASCTMGDECLCKRTIAADCYICGMEHAMALQELPDADLWCLLGWLAAGREPTREMVFAGAKVAGAPAKLRAMLVAAKETCDG